MTIEQLFFELIRVSIGTQDMLSRDPSAEEWQSLYDMAKKQSLVGICFAGVQSLTINHPSLIINLSEYIYLKWMGMAAKIQQRNEVVNRQCVELQERLGADGFRSCILKGQGVAQLYGKRLSSLRQSGDIDVFVVGGIKKAFEYCKQKYGKFEWDYINAHIPVFPDTEVELHWRVHSHPNIFKNKCLQKWFAEHEEDAIGGRAVLSNGESIVVPASEFNLFFILLHAYHHMFESGLGLRQITDFYFVLRTAENSIECKERVIALYKQFGMTKFASAIMWIMKCVFGIECKLLFCEPDEKEGRFILNEVMQNGNFGHHDERKHKIKNKMVAPFATRIQHNWHLATHYPSEFFWSPVWLIWHYVWKRNWIKNNR